MRMDEPTEDRLWWVMSGALTAKALALAAELGVADALGERARPVGEVAGEVGADAGTLHRLLRALASGGVFAEEEPGVFRNTEVSQLLRLPDWRAVAVLHSSSVPSLAALARCPNRMICVQRPARLSIISPAPSRQG